MCILLESNSYFLPACFCLLATYSTQVELYSSGRASFEEIAGAMGTLMQQGKIRGWGMCNDNACESPPGPQPRVRSAALALLSPVSP